MHLRDTPHGRLLVSFNRYPIAPDCPWLVLRAHHQPDEHWWETLYLAASHAAAWAWLDQHADTLRGAAA